MSEIEFTDRYQALGIPYPDPETICKGQCEGVGLYPHRISTLEPSQNEDYLWRLAHYRRCSFIGLIKELIHHPEWWYYKSIFREWIKYGFKSYGCDGWHFIKCSDCNGTGKRVII